MKIVDSDAFLEMPLSTQCLYFHLNMRADDDGFVGNANRIMRMIGAGDDDMKILLMKRFLLRFESGVIVIKHWRIHNTLKSDRLVETSYTDEKSMLTLKDNKSYTLLPDNSETKCFQNVSIDKSSRDKDSVDKTEIEDFFEKCWKAYPKKLGKGQVAESKKKKLYNEVGLEQMLRCIERYKQAKVGTDMQYIMHGSTFFNSGYVDFLDENCGYQQMVIQDAEYREVDTRWEA